jgi:hypothetical protein
MPFVAEVGAGRGEVLTRNAASKTGASTAEMGAAKAADMSATAKPADMSATAEPANTSATAKPADMGATAKPADMGATAEPSTVSTAEATTPAARERISSQSGGESGSRRQDDHDLT